MVTNQRLEAQIDLDGFAIEENVVSDKILRSLVSALENQDHGQSLRRQGSVYAVRNLLDQPEVVELAESSAVRTLVEVALGKVFFPVRGILFDKVPSANWKVPWHQDVTIAVRERFEINGFGPWSTKAGVLHVQPPANVLEKMISVRLHLDSCDETNGALQVLSGSHRVGRIPEDQITSILRNSTARVCSVNRGGALLMRPLLLHASSPSRSPAHRRVIHLDFATDSLPKPLEWLHA